MCPKDTNGFLIPQKNQCVDDCTKNPDYSYQFRHTCYKECPNIISEISSIKPFFCEAICTKEYPFEIIETQYCVNNCTIDERQKGLCEINYESKDQDQDEAKEAEEKTVENTKNELTNNFNT